MSLHKSAAGSPLGQQGLFQDFSSLFTISFAEKLKLVVCSSQWSMTDANNFNGGYQQVENNVQGNKRRKHRKAALLFVEAFFFLSTWLGKEGQTILSSLCPFLSNANIVKFFCGTKYLPDPLWEVASLWYSQIIKAPVCRLLSPLVVQIGICPASHWPGIFRLTGFEDQFLAYCIYCTSAYASADSWKRTWEKNQLPNSELPS